MKYTREFLLTQDGAKYSAKIAGSICTGIISVYGNKVYLCQNDLKGTDCPDKKGYKYSWVVYDSDDRFLEEQISDLTLTDKYTLQECQDQKITIITRKAEEANAIYDHFGKSNLFSLDEWREIGLNSPYDTKQIGFCNTPNWWKEQGLSKKSINFNQLILEEKQMKKGKIVAYKLLKDIPDAPKGTLFEKTTELYSIDGYNKQIMWRGNTPDYTTATKYNENFLIQYSEWFQPVYEEIIPKIGGYEVKKKSRYKATFGCVEIDISQLNSLALSMRNVISSSSSVQIREIRLTNDIFVTLKELDEVIAYLSTK